MTRDARTPGPFGPIGTVKTTETNCPAESAHGAPSGRICIYAFSSTAFFFRALIDRCAEAGDRVEWAVIQPQGHFRYVFDGALPAERRCYLYETFNVRYRADDSRQREQAMGSGEGLVTALFKDKDGYRWLDKEEQLRRGAAMDAVYRDFLMRIRPDYVLFPDLEVVDGFVLMNLCQELGIKVLYFASLRLLGVSFLSDDPYEALPPYIGAYSDTNMEEANAAIDAFCARRSKGPASGYPAVNTPKPSWFRRLIVSTYLRWTHERLHASEETFWMRIARHVLHIVNPLRRRMFDLLFSRYFDIQSQIDALPERYIFYALQYTPESSINGLEPYFVDQMRVIDSLLLNLPSGHRLVIKEHPAMVGVRSRSFYQQLRRKPGLVLVHPDVDSRWLTKQASVVTTVTGTIGLECYLLDKPCILFGRTAFSHLCYSAPPLRDLRLFIESVLASYSPPAELEKRVELAKLINIGGDFVIGDPWYSPVVMSAENVGAAREYLWKHMGRLETALNSDAPLQTR